MQHRPTSPAPCRFCRPEPEDFLPCYASALVFPGRTGLPDAILDAEKDLVPCFTGYCERCRNVRLLCSLAPGFPTRSAHHVHQIVLMRKLQATGILLK
jgi:hypothetical protein